MVVQIGDKLPEVNLFQLKDSLVTIGVSSYFSGCKVALFGVPGAFTPQCSSAHIPGVLSLVSAFRNAGIDKIACISGNDPFVMDAWSKILGAVGKIDFLADGNLEFTRGLGFAVDLSVLGMGMRSKRYSMLVDSCVVKKLQIEENISEVSVSSAESFLAQL